MPRALSVIVVGGGIGGLTAAIALRRSGHDVLVLEKSALAHEIGQGITLSSNGGRVLRDLGLDFERARIADYMGTNVVNAATLENMAPTMDWRDFDVRYGLRFKTAYRIDLHEELVRVAMAAETSESSGRPVTIRAETAVTSYNGDSGSVTLATGEVLAADLIVAADGVRSQAAAKQIMAPQACPEIDSSSTVVYRFSLPTKDVLSDPDTAHLLSAGDGMCTFNVLPDSPPRRWIVRYYCRDHEICNFAIYSLRSHSDVETSETGRTHNGLRFQTSREDLVKEMTGAHPALLKMCSMANDVLPLWRCTTREPLPKLHKDKLVVIGDAAHPVLPHFGLGAVSAIEDAGFLGALFADLSDDTGEPQDTVTKRLELFTQRRVPRVAAYKYWSDVPFFGKAYDTQKLKVDAWLDPADGPKCDEEMRPWYMSYDAAAEARDALREAGYA